MPNLNIIAIGASAGGLEALQEFLSHLPVLQNTCIIVAQHLSPTHKSMLVQLLSRETKLAVAEAVSGNRLEANIIYITPPDNEISIVNGVILLQKPASSVGPKPSVDVLFQSLADDRTNRIVGVILSGTGSDGAAGVKVLKESGGYLMAQEPETAKYDGMPLAAIQTGMVDVVLAPEKMGEDIQEYLNDPLRPMPPRETPQQEMSALNQILFILGKRTGTDFSNYKPATIGRRLEKRMDLLNVKSKEEYVKVLEKNPLEVDEMFKTILIGVTTFFRDIEAFGSLEDHLHKILAGKANRSPIRIWVPGCSTGEEPYSIAILLHRILRDRPYPHHIQIFATDIDEKAIAIARKGVYPERSLDNLPAEIKEQYFIHRGKEYELVKSVRAMVLFSKHDIIRNPPFLKLDMISCRNLLIYFNAVLQQQIIPIFHYALNPDGYLFLGKSETVGQFGDLFATLDAKNKIFQRKRGGNLHAIKFSAFKAQKQPLPQLHPPILKRKMALPDMVKETLFTTFEHSYVVVNEEFDVQEVSGDVRLFLSLTPGTIQVNLIKMVNPELQMEVRATLTKTMRERRSIKSNIKKFELFENNYYVRISAKPLISADVSVNLYIVIFEKLDIEEFISKTAPDNVTDIVNARILELEHELAATKEHLQTYIEEIETSNEELQSLNEELQSTNEELQSSNEELETSNEELQSTNEEIQIAYTELKTVNDELERKEVALQQVQANTQALLNNGLQAFVLVDTAYKILTFNSKAQETFLFLRGKQIKPGDLIIDLLPAGHVEHFIQEFAQAAQGITFQVEKELSSSQADKRWYAMNYSPVMFDGGQVVGISIGMLDITNLKEALASLSASERLVTAVFNAVSTGICITNEHGILVDANEEYCKIYGYTKEELIGQHFGLVVPALHRQQLCDLHDSFFMHGVEPPIEVDVVTKSGQIITVAASADLLQRPDGKRFKVTSIKEITEVKNVKRLLAESMEIARLGGWELDLATNHLSRTSITNQIYNVEASELLPFERLISFYSENGDIRKRLLQCLESGTPFDEEGELLSATGQVKWVRTIGRAEVIDGEVVRVFGTLQDITARKYAEQQMTAIAENLPGVIFRYQVHADGTDELLYYSDGVYRMWGIADKTIPVTIKAIWGAFHPDDVAHINLSIHKSAQTLEKWEAEWRVVHPDGTIRWHRGIGNPTRLPDGSTIWNTLALDITEEKHAQEELKRSYQSIQDYKNAIDQSSSLVITDSDGVILEVNDSSCRLSGYSRKELIGRHTRINKSGHHAQPFYAQMWDTITKGEIWRGEILNRRKDGSRYWVDTIIVPMRNEASGGYHYMALRIDITDKKEAEAKILAALEAVRESNERFEMVSQATNDAVWDWDIIHDLYYHGEGFYTLFGYKTSAAPEPLNLAQRVHPEDLDALSESLQTALKDPATSYWQHEYRYLCADGSYAFVVDRGVIMRDTDGTAHRIVGAMADVTSKKRYTEAIEQQNEKLRDIAWMQSHVVRAPLARIMGLVDLIANSTIPIDEKTAYVSYLIRSANELDGIIKEIVLKTEQVKLALELP